ncbi:hypothetical protein HG536_0B01880 [Torulaspora globosa]|uniref:Uncharacterized protein n=1 Tax=Torulaspora globosa TaxID=48254 RepID=A0A7G3ZCT9_9SACH|nr:uncharacterized protein HG536_0B01880 [Torulaspora globosa]QLL31325.1 hypothetical protein HG536_0B01880 [Torulaspora globosa]
MKAVCRRNGLKRYRCQKHSCGEERELYDRSTIQKLTEIFDFDYPASKEVLQAKQLFGSDSGGSRYDCSQCSGNSVPDELQYTPLETFSSPSYPLSLPPPGSDEDIQPVPSERRHENLRSLQEYVSAFVSAERRLLLHDLLSGDIYDS